MVPEGGRRVEILEFVRYRDEFYPSGFRKVLALLLVMSVTVMPEVFSWLNSPASPPAVSSLPTGRFHPSGGFLGNRDEPDSGALHTLWTFVKRSFVVIVATFGVMLYYPHSGFKRYALVCGPLMAFLVPPCIEWYLRGRTEVYRVELVLVSLVALLPGILLYIILTWRKARRLGMEW